MEPHQQYALYDGEASGTKQWVAHVRLTPELLQRLQQRPESVSIQLQAPGGNSSSAGGRSTRTSTASTKVSTVLTVDEGDGEEPAKYELLSFVEDPKVNVVCALRPDSTATQAATATSDDETKEMEPKPIGYSLYEVGRVYQKLIVQRMLDSTEKDRMKDRHAKSVLESKARASKFVAAEDMELQTTRSSLRSKSLKMKSGVTLLSAPPGKQTRKEIVPAKRRKLASALTPEAVQELQERIAKGGRGDDDEGELEMETAVEVTPTVQAKSSIFSSDSEAETSSKRLATSTKPPEAPISTGAADAVEATADGKDLAASKKDSVKSKPAKKAAAAKRGPKPKAKADTVAVEIPTSEAEAKTPSRGSGRSSGREQDDREEELPTAPPPVLGDEQPLPVNAASSAAAVVMEMPAEAKPLPPYLQMKAAIKSGPPVIKKRARPRASRLPDISFLPHEIQDICKHVASHITRTAILDAEDYQSFTAEYQRFRQEWEQLDKAYSIETILADGAHFQLPFAATDQEMQTLRQRIESAETKKEGLHFVRESMATIHKILASLQTSIAAYEQKTPVTTTK